MKRLSISFVLIVVILLLLVMIASQGSYKWAGQKAGNQRGQATSRGLLFVVYGTRYCEDCLRLKEFVYEMFGEKNIIFLDISERNNLNAFLNLLDLLAEMQLLIPPCPECLPKEDLLKNSPIPLTGVFFKGELKVIIVSFYSREFFLRALNYVNLTSDSTLMFIGPGYEQLIEDKDLINKLVDAFYNS